MSHPHNSSLCYAHLPLHRSSEGSQKRRCIWRWVGTESLGKEGTQISELPPLLSTPRIARAWSLRTSWHSWHLGTDLLLFISWLNFIQKLWRGNKYRALQILFPQNKCSIQWFSAPHRYCLSLPTSEWNHTLNILQTVVKCYSMLNFPVLHISIDSLFSSFRTG